MISDNTKKDLLWNLPALFIVALHVVTAYFMNIPKDLGTLYGLCFMALSAFMWYHHDKSGFGPYLVMVAAIIPFGHGRMWQPEVGWPAAEPLLVAYGAGFGTAYAIWIGKKIYFFFTPGGKEVEK